jgi:predicted chitinase
VGSETDGMGILRESMAYRTPARLCAVWPSRFGKKSDAFLLELISDPVKLADSVYGGRMGNRKGASDGYDTAGGMWVRTTGRYAVEKYCKALGGGGVGRQRPAFPRAGPSSRRGIQKWPGSWHCVRRGG